MLRLLAVFVSIVLVVVSAASALAKGGGAKLSGSKIVAHSITGKQVKLRSLPGTDITPGSLPASVFTTGSIGSGLLLHNGVLSFNPLLLSPFQLRVTGTCPSGEAIASINANGSDPRSRPAPRRAVRRARRAVRRALERPSGATRPQRGAPALRPAARS
jgi:hypothetical protein